MAEFEYKREARAGDGKRTARAKYARTGAVFAWVLVWFAAARALDAGFVVAGPVETAAALGSLLFQAECREAICRSFLTITASTCLASAAGLAVGLLAAKLPPVQVVLDAPVRLMKGAPVACIIVVLLMLAGSAATTGIVVAMVAFPPFYHAALEAASHQPEELHELFDVFRVSRIRRFLTISWPSSLPFFQAAAKTAVAMSWKAGVAAEIIGLPGKSIGEAVYLSKLSLDMASVLAWLAVVVALGWLSEKATLALLSASARSPQLAVKTGGAKEGGKAAHLHLELNRDASWQPICLTAPTGAGKTSVLRAVMGLPSPAGIPDESILKALGLKGRSLRFSVVFQEHRLVEELDAVGNVMLTCPSATRKECEDRLCSLLPADALKKPVAHLSGGMRRCVEIIRALLSDSDVLVLDEPFSGLDSESKKAAAQLIKELCGGRRIIMTSHVPGESELLGARVVKLEELQASFGPPSSR